MTSDNEKQVARRWPSFGTLVGLSLLLGLLTGLFFGEYCVALRWVGEAYVGLLQMSVLPYVALSLVVNVGRLSLADSRRLLVVGTVIILCLWLVGMALMMAMAQAFPVWKGGSFFSTSFVEEPPATDWLGLFVPSNPFRSLVENAIPAVVVFSIGLGVGLMNLPNKLVLLEPLDVVMQALAKLNKLVVQLSPIGMFAIVASTAGTLDLRQFELIQGYLLTYGAATILLSLFILPAIISSATPLKMGEVIRASRDPLVTALVIGNTFVVLPMIIIAAEKLLKKQSLDMAQQSQSPEYLVPMAYPFPDVGRIVGLIFIPFAAWFYGTIISPQSYPALMGVGLLGSLGKPVVTIPLLLQLAHLPSDIFQLFLASGVIAGRMGDVMKSMHLLTVTLLASCAMAGMLRIRWRKLLMNGAISVGLTILAVAGIRSYLYTSFQGAHSKEQLITERDLMFHRKRPLSTISPSLLDKSEIHPLTETTGKTRLDRIKERGIIRVGCDPDNLPFSYLNSRDQLVGFDVDMACFLANDLEVDIEFVPFQESDFSLLLDKEQFDVAMSGVEGSVAQATASPSIEPYMELTLALVVSDHRKSEFQTREQIIAHPHLKLGVIKGSMFAERAPQVLPNADEIVEFNRAAEYFEGGHLQVDGLVTSAEAGAAWTLLNPDFTVTNPLQGRVRVPLYYLTARNVEFELFLQNWLQLKRRDGTIVELYDYWILGKDDRPKPPRWCIIRDVLHWVE